MTDQAAATTRSFEHAYGVLAAGGLLSLAGTFVAGTDAAGLHAAAVIAPGLVLLAGLVAIVVLARGGIDNLVSPTAVLCIVLAGYFGLGALVPAVAPQDLANFMQDEFPYTAAEMVKADRVTAVGALALAATAWFLLRASPPRRPSVGSAADRAYVDRVATRLIVLGTGVRLLVTTPYLFGSRRQLLPGVIGSLDMLAYLGLLVLAYGVASGLLRTRHHVVLLVIAGGVNILLGVVSLSKLNIFMPAVAMAGGILLARQRRATIAAIALGMVAAYVVIQPVVTVGRMLFSRGAHTVDASLEAVSRSAALLSEAGENQPVAGYAFARFSYVAPTVLAVREYDEGRRGTSMTNKLPWVFVPRVLWPAKPNMTTTGREVAIMLNGNDENTVGMGIFAEGYWNGGYPVVALAAAFVGLLMAVFEGVRWRALDSFDVVWLYLLLQGTYMAEEISAYFVQTYVGFWPIIAVTALFLRAAVGGAPAADPALARAPSAPGALEPGRA